MKKLAKLVGHVDNNANSIQSHRLSQSLSLYITPTLSTGKDGVCEIEDMSSSPPSLVPSLFSSSLSLSLII